MSSPLKLFLRLPRFLHTKRLNAGLDSREVLWQGHYSASHREARNGTTAISNATCGRLAKVGNRSCCRKGTLFPGIVSEIAVGDTLALHKQPVSFESDGSNIHRQTLPGCTKGELVIFQIVMPSALADIFQ